MSHCARLVLLTAVSTLALLFAGSASADSTLIGSVGMNDAFRITLTDSSGNAVTHLDPGAYTLVVHDFSDLHDFHLTGPGVDVATDVAFKGDMTFTITLTDGTYQFMCDPHSTVMHGAFTVGTPPAPAPKPTPTAGRLVATVGPGFKITLRTSAGAAVKRLSAGTYTIVVHDLARIHDFHLSGPGVSKKTAVSFKGTVTWKVKLVRGTYRYVCDPHRTLMHGSFRVV